MVCTDIISANRGSFPGIFSREADVPSHRHLLQISLNSISIRKIKLYRNLSFITVHSHTRKMVSILASQTDLDTFKVSCSLVLL